MKNPQEDDTISLVEGDCIGASWYESKKPFLLVAGVVFDKLTREGVTLSPIMG